MMVQEGLVEIWTEMRLKLTSASLWSYCKNNQDLKDRIRELEDEGTKNPHQKWIFLAQAVDSWRIFPRAFLTVYIFLLYYTVMWFMELEAPSFEQSGLISIVVGAGAAWFGLYAGTSGSSKSFKGEDK
jgi:hypothetical protein